MSRSASVSLIWGDGRHQFRLAIAELDELDELCQVGPGYLLAQLNGGVYGPWRARAVRETIRLGLVGGGKPPAAAVQLMERYFDRSPIGDHLVTAQAILMACVLGDENDPPGEDQGGAAAPISPAAASGSGPSGSAPAPSASPTSDVSASGSSTAFMPAGGAPTSRRTRRRQASATKSATS